MPLIRTTKGHIKAAHKKSKKRPCLTEMFVSVSRVTPYIGFKWNSQISLWRCDPRSAMPDKHSSLQRLDFDEFTVLIEQDLDIDVDTEQNELYTLGGDWCLAWRMSESGRWGRIYDDDSFQAAVEDHRRSYKSIVDLFIIDSKNALKESTNLY